MYRDKESSDAAPGLRWRRRASGDVPYWIAKPAYVAAGYPVKTANLSSLAPDQIAQRCRELEVEALAYMGGEGARQACDGSLRSLLAIYQTHEESPFHALKPSSRKPYAIYLRHLEREHGDARLATMTGLDVKGWHKTWRAPAERGGRELLGKAAMKLAILKAALSFGIVSGFPDCDRLCLVLSKLELPGPKPRDQAPEAADIERARAAAHKLGRHRAAFCYALQFETTARQWDLIGQWTELSDPRPSTVLDRGKKWFGPTWANIDANLILSIKPSKTNGTTGATVHVNLSRCPMVMEELARIPEAARVGPLIVNETTGLPYRDGAFNDVWQAVRDEAELPLSLWNRDIRAGGITEAQKAGAAAEDRAKMAGHSQKVNEAVYARDRLAASDRVVEARERFRRGAK